MSENLERLLRSTEGQPPSDEFRAQLRALLVAETEGTPVATDTTGNASAPPAPLLGDPTAVEVHEMDPPGATDDVARRRAERTSRMRTLIASAAAIAAVVVGIWVLTNDDRSELDTIQPPEESTTVEPDEDEPLSIGDPITGGNTAVGPGEFRVDTLGTEFAFSVDELFGVSQNENGVFSIGMVIARSADDNALTFRRSAVLPNPSESWELLRASDGWPATDLAGWVAQLPSGVQATEPVAATIGGANASLVELVFECDALENCQPADPIANPNVPMFTRGSSYHLWVVDQGDEDPILITASIDGEGDGSWFAEARRILSTLEFGPVRPSPIRTTSTDSVVLEAFDGVRVDLPGAAQVVEPYEGFTRLLPEATGGDVELLTRPLDVDGQPVNSTDELLDLLRQEAVVVTEADTLDVDGTLARVFDLDSGGTPNVILKTREADLVRSEFGWESPRFGRLWILEHADRGFLIVSAEALTPDNDIDGLRTWTEAMLQSLTFEES